MKFIFGSAATMTLSFVGNAILLKFEDNPEDDPRNEQEAMNFTIGVFISKPPLELISALKECLKPSTPGGKAIETREVIEVERGPITGRTLKRKENPETEAPKMISWVAEFPFELSPEEKKAKLRGFMIHMNIEETRFLGELLGGYFNEEYFRIPQESQYLRIQW